MPANACKVCLVGDAGVGKTSFVRRMRPEAAPSRGISLHRFELGPRAGSTRAVMFWDVDGRSAIDCLNQAFLSGADAVLAIADATRPATLDTARRLIARVRQLRPAIPALLLLNKRDLGADVGASHFRCDGVPGVEMSLRTGHGVSDALRALADVLPAA